MAEEIVFSRLDPLPRATLDLHFELFSTDGVSMQSQELTGALRSRKWPVHLAASDAGPGSGDLRLPELSYQSDDSIALRRNSTAIGKASSSTASASTTCCCQSPMNTAM